MFVSIHDKADDKYERKTKNFFKLKRHDSASKWQPILDEDNSKIFEIEMAQTLIDVNRFITKIEIDSDQLNQLVDISKKNEKKFKEYLAIGRELLIKLKLLATLEKASAMEKYEQSNVRKLSYITATSDTVSCADTENVVEGHGAIFHKEESIDRRDSRTITLVHKYAATFTSHYEIFDKLNHDVEEIVERFNKVLDFIHRWIQQRADHPINYDHEMKNESKIRTIDDSVDDKVHVEIKCKQEVKSDSISAVEILIEHLRLSSLQPIFEHVSASGSGHLVEHRYSCSVAGQYCESKSRKKSNAKEQAAAQMIKELIKRQKYEELPPQIIPFTEIQIHELSIALTEREDLIDKLEENCLHLHEPPPLYTVLSETGRSNEPYFTVKCEAMGYIALGHGSSKSQAKRNAAKSILNLLNVNEKGDKLGN